MDFLPKEIEDIIYEYSHHLKMKVILDELKESFYTCRECFYDNFNHIISYKQCDCCKEPICNYCEEDLECPDNELCNDCFFNHLICGFTEDIIKRKLKDSEYDSLFDLHFDLHWKDKQKIVGYLMYILDLFEKNKDYEIDFIDLCGDIQDEIDDL